MNDQIPLINIPNLDLFYYIYAIRDFLVNHFPWVFDVIRKIIGILIGISIPLSVFFLIAIVITIEGLKQIRTREEEKYSAPPVDPGFTDIKAVQEGDIEFANRWNKVMEHMSSVNENDWRQAIIEADIMLEDLLVRLGYRGEGIGERLRRAEKGDFKTLDLAGEAHGIRNRIAHDGSNYPLNQIEAQRVIALYRQVFEEFYHIS